MRNILNNFCPAVVMLAISVTGFAEEVQTNTQNTDLMASSYDSRKPMKRKKVCDLQTVFCAPCDDEPCCFFEQGLALADDFVPPCDVEYDPAYNAAAEINVDNAYDLNVEASYLYWNVSQDGMDVSYMAPLVGVGVSNGSVLDQNTGYKSGFKVGIGWDTHFDNWTLNADYTWFHHTLSTTGATGNFNPTKATTGRVPGFKVNDWNPGATVLNANDYYKNVSSDWTMHMDLLDVVVGRPYYQGTHLTIAPTIGLRGLWIRQSMDVELTGFAIASDETTTPILNGALNASHCWAVGPKAGVESHWILWKGLRIEGVMGASVLYTRYTTTKNTELQIHSGITTTAASKKRSYGTIRPTVDMGLGLGYGAYTYRNNLYIDLSVRYDFAQFWSQNVMRNFASQLIGQDDVIGDLHLHGLTVNLRFDF